MARGGRPENVPYLPRVHSKWKHLPTTLCRHPKILSEGLEAIAHWADEQDDPERAIGLILEFIKDKG